MTQSYGTVFEISVYDTNNRIVPLFFSHSVGTDRSYTWGTVFEDLKEVDRFDCDGRTTIVDQEKALESTLRSAFAECNIFMDMLHVKKNMAPSIRTEKTTGLHAYKTKVRATLPSITSVWTDQYGAKKEMYMYIFPMSGIYKFAQKTNKLRIYFTGQ